MENKQEHLQAITDIRSMMERSSRFISLSGLSGVFAGIFALIGAYYAHWYINILGMNYAEYASNREFSSSLKGAFIYIPLIADAIIVLVCSLTVGVILTVRNSKKNGIKVWDGTSKRLLINLMIPLFSGGIFCLAMAYYGIFGLLAPATLIFYGLALINASKYTLNDIRYLGLLEIALGLIACFYLGYGLLFWAIGFGVLHIIYGGVMYLKYERK